MKASTHERVNVIYQHFLDAMRDGKLGSGDKLPTQSEMASQFDESKLVVRHACAKLEEYGLIVQTQGRGIQVCDHLEVVLEIIDNGLDLEKGNLAEQLEARMIFEPVVVGLAAELATAEEIRDLQLILNKIARAKDWLLFKEQIYSFFRAIYVIYGNRCLIDIFDLIFVHRKRLNFGGSNLKSQVNTMIKQYMLASLEPILLAMKQNNKEAAQAASCLFLQNMTLSLHV